MKVVEDFESRPHKAVSFVVERDKEIQEWTEQKLPKVLPGYSGRRLPGKSIEEKSKKEEKLNEDYKELQNKIIQEAVASIKEKASEHKDAKSTAVGQSVKQNENHSQIEKEEEEEVEEWQLED